MSLDVYVGTIRVGTLFAAGDSDCRFAYPNEAPVIEGLGPGKPVLSNWLPVRPEPFRAELTRAYTEQLLPEGLRRRRVAKELGVDADDGYAMLAELGRDCAGAVVMVPEGEPLNSDPAAVRWLSEAELEELTEQPPVRLFDPEAPERMRFALAGEHHKLALIRDEARDRWGWPTSGIPSTHIVKPESGEFPDHVLNEMFCMTVAREAGLLVAETALETLGGRRCLVVRRFDRAGEGLEAQRLHQETFCQALGHLPDADDYDEDDEEEGGGEPGFYECAGLLRAVDATGDIALLIRAALCNYVLGNGDAHPSNFALLRKGDVQRLAPLYDITSTVVYDEPMHTGMVINYDYTDTAFLVELTEMSEECGVNIELFRQIVALTAARLGDSLRRVADRAREQGWHAPVLDDILELGTERAIGLGAEVGRRRDG